MIGCWSTFSVHLKVAADSFHSSYNKTKHHDDDGDCTEPQHLVAIDSTHSMENVFFQQHDSRVGNWGCHRLFPGRALHINTSQWEFSDTSLGCSVDGTRSRNWKYSTQYETVKELMEYKTFSNDWRELMSLLIIHSEPALKDVDVDDVDDVDDLDDILPRRRCKRGELDKFARAFAGSPPTAGVRLLVAFFFSRSACLFKKASR